jgi:hypothetical protein
MEVRKRRLIHAAASAATLALIVVTACDNTTTAPADSGNARVSVWLTDAPGGIAEAWVQIDGIYLQGRASGEDGDGEGDGDMSPPAHFSLLEEPTGWINLVELADETLVIAEDVVVEAGTFSELRFVLGEAILVTDDGAVYATSGADLEALNAARQAEDPELEPLEGTDGDLQCPSCSHSGLKVKFPGDGDVDIPLGGKILVLDFDVSQSFGHIAGKSGRWIMHPVIIGDEIATEGVGEIAGLVSLGSEVSLPECGGGALDLSVFVPIARLGDEERTTSVGTDGAFLFDGVAPGEWEMDFVSAIDFDNGDQLVLEATSDPASVSVEADATAVLDYTITGATCNTGG